MNRRRSVSLCVLLFNCVCITACISYTDLPAGSQPVQPVLEPLATTTEELNLRTKFLRSSYPTKVILESKLIKVIAQKGQVNIPPHDLGIGAKSQVATREPVIMTEIVCLKGQNLGYVQSRSEENFSVIITCNEDYIVMLKNRGTRNALAVEGEYLQPKNSAMKIYFHGHEGVEVVLCSTNPKVCN